MNQVKEEGNGEEEREAFSRWLIIIDHWVEALAFFTLILYYRDSRISPLRSSLFRLHLIHLLPRHLLAFEHLMTII